MLRNDKNLTTIGHFDSNIDQNCIFSMEFFRFFQTFPQKSFKKPHQKESFLIIRLHLMLKLKMECLYQKRKNLDFDFIDFSLEI